MRSSFLSLLLQDQHAESPFHELLKFVERNHQLPCDVDAGGCGNMNYITQSLSSSPHIFTVGK